MTKREIIEFRHQPRKGTVMADIYEMMEKDAIVRAIAAFWQAKVVRERGSVDASKMAEIARECVAQLEFQAFRIRQEFGLDLPRVAADPMSMRGIAPIPTSEPVQEPDDDDYDDDEPSSYLMDDEID